MSTEEKDSLEVFGTREVSVKEFMGSEDKSLVLLSDFEKAKQNLDELRDKYEPRVNELYSLEVLSPSELKELNSIRAELREPRYLIQKIEKNNVSVFEAYKKNDRSKLKELIDINIDLEELASNKIKAEDDRKKLEKEAEAKAEENRIAKINEAIENVETYCYEVIQKITFENLSVSKEVIEQSLSTDYDFEEYYLLFDQVKERIEKMLSEKVKDVTEREEQRLANESMKKEIFEVRIIRLKELGYDFNGDIFSFEKSFIEKDSILNANALDFEKTLSDIKSKKELAEQEAKRRLEEQNQREIQAKLDAEKAEREAKELQEKNEQFEVRKNRLAEIGFVYSETFFRHKEFSNLIFSQEVIYNDSIMEFEKRLVNEKALIIDCEKEKEQKELKLLEAKKQEELAKKKADSENKARVKRLASDKKNYSLILQSALSSFPSKFDLAENVEIKEFSVECSYKITALLNELLTKLNEL
jgi:hypothetical protein